MGFSSVLLLTILLAIGLVFFLRAASKDRTTVLDLHSPLPPLAVLNGITNWLEERGWRAEGGDVDRRILKFNGIVGRLLKKLFTGRLSSKKGNFKFPSLDKSDICERVNRLKFVLGIKENLECKLLSERTILIKRR